MPMKMASHCISNGSACFDATGIYPVRHLKAFRINLRLFNDMKCPAFMGNYAISMQIIYKKLKHKFHKIV